MVTAATITRDAWDGRDFDSTAGHLPPLTEAVDQLTEASALGTDMARDVFAAMHKRAPQSVETVPASHAVNAAVRDAMLDSPAYRELHPKCVGDSFLSGVAVSAMTSELVDLYGRLSPDIEKAARKVADAEQAYKNAVEADAARDASDPAAEQILDDLLASLTEARGELDKQTAAARATIGRAARAATQAARDEVVDCETAGGVWAGLAGGELTATDPGRRFELMRLLRTGTMKRVTDLFGRMKSLSIGARETRWTRGPDEVFSVTVGDDLDCVLPDELAGLGVPGLTEDFYRRYTAGELLCYDLRRRERVGRGPIVFVEDSSGSMEGPRYEAAKAIGLALATTANGDGRAFRALVFGGSGTFVEFEVTGVEQAVDYASKFLNSAGTDLEAPLDRALQIVADDDDPDMRAADIVVVTDGYVNLNPKWVLNFCERKAALGARVWSIVVDADLSPAILSVSDRAVRVDDLLTADGTASVAALFADVTTEPAAV